MTRLPTPGGDAGNWGSILNEYLSAVHNTDGSLKTGVVAGSNLASGSITTDKLADAAITPAKLASSVQTTLSSVVTTSTVGAAGGIASLDSSGKVPVSQLPEASGGTTPAATASVSGTIRLTGDLGGSATSPSVVKLNGVSLTGTPSAGQALVATSSTAAGWQVVSGGTNPNAGTVWNTTSDPASGSSASSVGDGDLWVDGISDQANILTKVRTNGQWVEMFSSAKPTDPVDDNVTGLTASNITSTGLTLSWTAPSNPSGTIDGYNVYNNGTKLTNPPVVTTSFDVTLPAETAYSLTVAAVVGGQEKTASPATTGTTPPADEPEPTTGLAWPLKISANGRYIVDANNAPFLWQGDTAWTLFSRLTREQTSQYLDTRKAQGFNVIQAVAIPRVENSIAQNRYNDEPTSGGSVANRVITAGSDVANASQYDYWDHVDYVIDQANSRDMAVALFPVWSATMAGNEINAANAQEYGQFLGARYKAKKIIWVMGGDNNNGTYGEIWGPLAKGIAIGVNGSESYENLLITYHPGGAKSSGEFFHNTAWLNFNMSQSSHSAAVSYVKVEEDYVRNPARPTIDGEPLYEDHPYNWNPADGYSTPHHVRAREYCAVFAGAFGFTYGHHSIWQFYQSGSGLQGANYPNCSWSEALTKPAATQMIHLKNLLLSRPVLTRVPDQSIITSAVGALNGKNTLTRHQATRNADGSYIMVYLTNGGNVSIDTSKLSSSSAKQWWYNPRTGQAGAAENKSLSGTMTFSAPSNEDWVLVLDDASRNYPAPGTV